MNEWYTCNAPDLDWVRLGTAAGCGGMPGRDAPSGLALFCLIGIHLFV
jgi:hypothetical protein